MADSSNNIIIKAVAAGLATQPTVFPLSHIYLIQISSLTDEASIDKASLR